MNECVCISMKYWIIVEKYENEKIKVMLWHLLNWKLLIKDDQKL